MPLYRFLATGLAAYCMTVPALADDKAQPPESIPAPFISDSTFNQNPADGKLKGETLRIKRSMLIVSDLKRSLDFYENVIGLEVYSVDDVYQFDRGSMGHAIFNTEHGTRRRVATINTSTETRGLALREIDTKFEVPQSPRLSAILFEASDILGIYERATEAGATVVDPRLGFVAATEDVPELRYLELAVIDPDGHTLAFFKYYTDAEDEAWQDARKRFQTEIER